MHQIEKHVRVNLRKGNANTQNYVKTPNERKPRRERVNPLSRWRL